MLRPGLVLLLIAPLLSAELRVVETAHYRLETDAAPEVAAEFARLLEAAYAEFKAYFKAKPKLRKGEKLAIRFFETRQAWAAAIAADEAEVPKAGGGLYWPANRVAYAYRQPTELNTRQILLHEATHQFHYLAKTRNRKPAAAWYEEGVAEFLARHFWDGRRLQLGVLPLITQEDQPKRALAQARAEDFDFERLIAGEAPCDYAMAWAVYRWLLTGNRGKPVATKWKGLERKLDGGVKPGSVFRKFVGPPRALRTRFVTWLEGEQEPFVPLHVEWQGIGPQRMRGFSKRSIACRSRRKLSYLDATLERPDKPGWRGGVLLAWTDDRHYAVALIDWQGFVRIAKYVDSGWQTLEQGEVPGVDRDKDLRFQLFRRGDSVTMMIGNVGFGPWELEGEHFGLAVERCDLRFSKLAWK